MQHIGFTGSRNGLSDAQTAALAQVLVSLEPLTLHHGDCVGADAHAHQIAEAAGWPTVTHPPLDESNNLPRRRYRRNTGVKFSRGTGYDLYTVAQHEIGHSYTPTDTRSPMWSPDNGVKTSCRRTTSEWHPQHLQRQHAPICVPL